MKKFMFIGAAALLMFTATGFTASAGYEAESLYLTATPKDDVDYTKCKFDCKDFTGLDIGGIMKVNLVKSDKYKVEVTLPSALKEYLEVTVKNGVLKIGWNKNIPSKLQKELKSWTCKADIAMPGLRKLEMSGASSLSCNDTFDLGDEELSLDISGVSELKSLNVNARKLDAEISGASSYKIVGNFYEKAELDLSGASKGSIQVDADILEAEISGATKTTLDGNFGKAEIDASGTSELSLKGRVKTLEIDASGASKIKAMGAEAEEAILETSGTANCNVNVTRSIIVNDATGVSEINYKAPKHFNIKVNSISRLASVNKVN